MTSSDLHAHYLDLFDNPEMRISVTWCVLMKDSFICGISGNEPMNELPSLVLAIKPLQRHFRCCLRQVYVNTYSGGNKSIIYILSNTISVLLTCTINMRDTGGNPQISFCSLSKSLWHHTTKYCSSATI